MKIKGKVFILLILTNLFWAGNFVFGKMVGSELSPLWITFSRWVLALIILFPLAFFLEKKPDWKLVRKNWHLLVIQGILGVIAYNLFLYQALRYTSATNAALVNTINPGVIVFFSFLLLKEKMTTTQILGLLLSLFGAIVVLTKGNIIQILHDNYNAGDILMIGAVIVWTFYSLLGRRIPLPPITTTAFSTLFAMMILAPFAFYQGIDFSKITTIGIIGIIYMVLFPSACSFVFWNMALKQVSPNQAGIFLNLIPVFTAIIGLFLGESISSQQIVGGAFVFLGVILTSGLKIKHKHLEHRRTF
ncbi:DMT family transporter [Niallia sp. 01092]|uniref:DMT family transporter n=1 Tax=unclassified Niallia TaxID=2837522 RepID=UPI003FD65F33